MGWKQIILCSLLAAAGFGAGLLVGMDAGEEPRTVTMAAPGEVQATAAAQTALPPSVVSPSPSPQSTEKQYLLMLSGESICIYALLEDGGTELIQKTEIDTGQLRQEDFENLCRGITVTSLEKAKSLCEDFGN